MIALYHLKFLKTKSQLIDAFPYDQLPQK